MRIEPLDPAEVVDFLAWRGGSGHGAYLAALDSEICQHLGGLRFIFLAKEDAKNTWIGTVSLALFHDDEELADGRTRVYLQALEVVPGWRRRGVGTRLTQHVSDVARERGFEILTLAVEPYEEAAQALYRNLGFRKFKTSEFEWEGKALPVDCLCLHLQAKTL